jgi:hypothetical protein
MAVFALKSNFYDEIEKKTKTGKLRQLFCMFDDTAKQMLVHGFYWQQLNEKLALQ